MGVLLRDSLCLMNLEISSSRMSLTLAQQRKLPGGDVREKVGFAYATSYGLRR